MHYRRSTGRNWTIATAWVDPCSNPKGSPTFRRGCNYGTNSFQTYERIIARADKRCSFGATLIGFGPMYETIFSAKDGCVLGPVPNTFASAYEETILGSPYTSRRWDGRTFTSLRKDGPSTHSKWSKDGRRSEVRAGPKACTPISF